MSVYNEGLCEEKHRVIESRLDDQENRLDKHDTEIGGLKISEGKHQMEINQLCKSIDDLVKSNKWFIRLMGSSIVGLLFYLVQQALVK